MLELFFKHLDYIGIQSGREHESCEKRGFKFTDAETQKHWLSFCAVHKGATNKAAWMRLIRFQYIASMS